MRRTKKSELRVFKLRSGEEIIAKVSGKTKDKIKLTRPMRIMQNFQTDPFTGTKRQIVYFSNWLGSTSELSAEIPLDFVVVELSPDPDLITLYSRQMESDDRNDLTPPSSPKNKSQPLPIIDEEEIKKLSDEVDRKLEEMLKQMAEDGAKGVNGEAEKKSDPSPLPPFPFMPPIGGMGMPPRIPNSILFSVSIPQEILSRWVESGFIDYLKDSIQDFVSTDFLEEMMNDEEDEVPKKPKKKKREKISKDEWVEPTEDLKKKPNYGNSHDDWSPYLKDYLPEQDPPKNEEGG